jgi:hypothetical protein
MTLLVVNEAEEVKKHFYLVAGEIVFKTKEGEMGSIRLNALVVTNEPKFAVHQINLAQQALQMHFHKRHTDPVEVVDVVMNGLMYLGLFTDKEFHAVPEGMRVQQLRTEGNA